MVQDRLIRYLLFEEEEHAAAVASTLQDLWALVDELKSVDIDAAYAQELVGLTTSVEELERGVQATLEAYRAGARREDQQKLLADLYPIAGKIAEHSQILLGHSAEFLGRRETMAIALALQELVGQAAHQQLSIVTRTSGQGCLA